MKERGRAGCMCAYERSGESRKRERRVDRLPNLLQYYCLLLGTVPCGYSNFTVPVTLRIFFSPRGCRYLKMGDDKPS